MMLLGMQRLKVCCSFFLSPPYSQGASKAGGVGALLNTVHTPSIYNNLSHPATHSFDVLLFNTLLISASNRWMQYVKSTER